MSKIDYPFSTVIYSKDSYVNQHRRCLFNAKENRTRATHDHVIDHVIWQHCGKGSGTFWTDTNCSTTTCNRTKFCLQDIKDICDYNGVQYELFSKGLRLTTTKDCIEICADFFAENKHMYVIWIYRPFIYMNGEKMFVNQKTTAEHLITVLDMEQLKRMFDFNKL